MEESRLQCPAITSRNNSKKNVQEHRRVAYEQVEIAASLAASHTAAKMPPRLRDIENNTEANVSQQQRILSEITSESAQAVGAQRQSLIHEATAEMMRRQPHQEAVVSQFRSELQHYYHPLESPSEEFQQSQAELRHIVERSNAEGTQLRNLIEESRTANASIAPELTRLQA